MLEMNEDLVSARIFVCPQCPKLFATRSNLKRHMENPNIHNIPYVRSRDQKRWKGHSKRVVTREETTESNNDRMRKWRAENREKNRQNDLRCRVYRLARQKFGDTDSSEKQGFVRDEISRRLGRRMLMEKREPSESWPSPMKDHNSIRMTSPVHFATPPSTPVLSSSDNMLLSPLSDLGELPFFSAPHRKITLPSIDQFTRAPETWTSPPEYACSSASSPILPHLSPNLHAQRRTSSSSISSMSSIISDKHSNPNIKKRRRSTSPVLVTAAKAALESIIRSSLSVNTSPIPTSQNMLPTPTTPSTTSQNLIKNEEEEYRALPSMHNLLSYAESPVEVRPNQQQQRRCIPTITAKGGIKYVESNKILDEFAGVALNYVDLPKSTTQQ